jgi:3-oxoacyl-[acyl-carrier protein] reductase
VNIVVNNAGLFPRLFTPAGFEGKPVRFWESDPAGYLRIMSVNTVGQFFVARAATPLMLTKRWGRIINISTSFDTMLRGGAGAYGPSKGAVEAQSANWAEELAGTGVTVNVLIPGGSVDTTLPMPPTPTPGKQSPLVMQGPLPWLASERSNGVSGVRFIANLWDTKLPPDHAAKRFTQRAAWPDLAAASAEERKNP